jgi:hypothetical protein
MHAHWESEAAVADGMCPICLQAEIERLRTALEPFANMAVIALHTPGDCAFGTMSVEIVHLIRAKAALGDENGTG